MKSLSDTFYVTGLALVCGGLLTESKGVGLLGVVSLVASGLVTATDQHRQPPTRLTPKETAAVLLASLDDDCR